MIWGTWVDPNFRFRAVDEDGHPEEHFCYAASAEELRERLKAKNMVVQSIEIEPYDFSEWKKRACKATRKAIKAYQAGKRPINFKREIWAELKWHLFGLFHGKCAYCESKPQAVSSGDVEHYRPKGKVDGEQNHPGYYWLAYEITNLLPACESCNRNFGKMNYFPVKGAYAYDHQQNLASEEPLLLSPYNSTVNPLHHLEFNEMGVAIPHEGSPYGESSKKYYHLNRQGIGEARRKAISEVQQDWSTLIIRLSGLGSDFVYKTLWEEITLGHREYSAAQLWELDRITKRDGV